MVSGVALLAASVIAGLLWDRYGPPASFFAGMSIAGVALNGLLVVQRQRID